MWSLTLYINKNSDYAKRTKRKNKNGSSSKKFREEKKLNRGSAQQMLLLFKTADRSWIFSNRLQITLTFFCEKLTVDLEVSVWRKDREMFMCAELVGV